MFGVNSQDIDQSQDILMGLGGMGYRQNNPFLIRVHLDRMLKKVSFKLRTLGTSYCFPLGFV